MNEIVSRTAAGTAVASLKNLKAGLQNVASTIVTAGGDPFLRLGTDGVWVYGAENIEVQEGSLWAVNPLSIQHGWVSWTDHPGKQANEIVGEVMVPMTAALPSRLELRDTGWDWTEQLSVQVKCINGEDVGTQVLYKTTSVGGKNAVKALISKIIAQLDVDPDRCVPVIELGTDYYMHKKWGKTYTPVFDVVRFIEMDGGEGGEGETAPQQVTAAPEPKAEPETKVRTRRQKATSEPTAKEPAKAEGNPESPAERKARLARELAELETEEQTEATAPVEEKTESAEPAPRRRRRA